MAKGEGMSKRQTRKQAAAGKAITRRKVLVSLILLSVVVAVSGIFAQQVTKRKKQSTSSIELSPANLTANDPAKEYVYGGSKLIATKEPTANSNGDDAEFVSMVINPNDFGDDQYHRVLITMKNVGTTTWSASAGFQLRPEPSEIYNWGRAYVNLPQSVVPGSSVTFDFTAAKIYNPGSGYINFQWQMARNGSFFGEKTRNQPIQAGAWLPLQGPNLATFVSQSVPTFMFAGQSYNVSVTMTNSGTNTWSVASNHKLGSQCPQDNNYWGLNRVSLPGGNAVASGASANFAFTATAPLTAGVYNFEWMMVEEGGAGFFETISPPTDILINSKAALGYLDYNLDNPTDISVWRASTRQWLIDTNLNGTADNTYTFGLTSGGLPVPSDYDGDRKADLAYIKTNSMQWNFDYNRDGTADSAVVFGAVNDIPVPQDYNGDCSADLAVYRPSTGLWYLDTNRDGTADQSIGFGGVSGDIPCPADFTGDGLADLVIFRPSAGQWYIDSNRDGTADSIITLGQSGDLPVATDFNKDGKADLVIFRPSTGQWYIDTDLNGTANYTVTLGQSGDIPVAGDYNGDNKTDIAVFRPSSTKWYIDTDLNGTANYTLSFGTSGDMPLRQNGWILKAMGLTSQ
jgi:hypothetical protein